MATKRKTVKFPYMMDGERKYYEVPWVPAKKKMTIDIIEADVQKAIDERGVADPGKCAGAQACKRLGVLIPKNGKPWGLYYHSRAYFVSRYKKNGEPALCVCYRHNDKMARDFDTDTLKLWALVQQRGKYTVHLYPAPKSPDLSNGKWRAAHEKSKRERAAGKPSLRPKGTLERLRVRTAEAAGNKA